MPGDTESSESDRALAPPGHLRAEALRWVCPECDYWTRGTIDAPYNGDGTCPRHSRQALQLADTSDTKSAGLGPGASE
jgi:hypothetical protein